MEVTVIHTLASLLELVSCQPALLWLNSLQPQPQWYAGYTTLGHFSQDHISAFRYAGGMENRGVGGGACR